MSMMKTSRLLLDTNVWLDYFLDNEQTAQDIETIVAHGFAGTVELYFAPTSAKDVFYLIPRQLRRMAKESDPGTTYLPAAWGCVERMLEIATAAPISQVECEFARMLKTLSSDYEDNLVLAAAETAKADYVVTSDKRLIASAPETCITPHRAVALISFTHGNAE